MFYCNLHVLLCTEIAVQEDFVSTKYDFWRDLKGGGLKKFSRLAIACHVLLLRYKL